MLFVPKRIWAYKANNTRFREEHLCAYIAPRRLTVHPSPPSGGSTVPDPRGPELRRSVRLLRLANRLCDLCKTKVEIVSRVVLGSYWQPPERVPSAERVITQAFQDTRANIIAFVYTLYLFTKSDLKTIFVPAVRSSSWPPYSMSPYSPNIPDGPRHGRRVQPDSPRRPPRSGVGLAAPPAVLRVQPEPPGERRGGRREQAMAAPPLRPHLRPRGAQAALGARARVPGGVARAGRDCAGRGVGGVVLGE